MKRMNKRLSLLCLLVLMASLVGSLLALVSDEAFAKSKSGAPSVLVIDAGLGDYEACSLHWLGKKAKVLATGNGFELATSSDPNWWADGGGKGAAPATFVLGCPTGTEALEVSDIAWALDQIGASGAERRTFVVAMGATGLRLREYAEDLGSVRQSSRADIVGMAFCGMPQNGYSALPLYPEMPLWETVAHSVGLTTADLTPGSAYLVSLNERALPAVTKSLMVNGIVGDLGFGRTDGLCVDADYALGTTVSDQSDKVEVDAVAGENCDLTSSWTPFTSEVNYPQRNIDPDLTERLSAKYGYETSGEVKRAVRAFYQEWFDRAPVTFNANTLLLDISGSMNDQIEPGTVKLQAAQHAAKEYLRAMQAVSKMPHAAPMSANVYGFALQTTTIASGYDKKACDAIDTMTAYDETDIGQALDKAVAALQNTPTCASRRIVLLSDGESTRGQSDAQVMAGAVARAKANGIVIDTIGFGSIGESDEGFLHGVSDATGGAYYSATDTFSLKIDFLKSYYTSLGLKLLDEEVKAGSPATIKLGSADQRTSALQIGIVAQKTSPTVKLKVNGKEPADLSYDVQEEYGLTTIQVLVPPMGEYTLEMSGDTGTLHVFAVQQEGIVTRSTSGGQKHDVGLYILIGGGAALIVGIMAVVLRSLRKRSAATSGPGSYPGGGY